MATGKNNCITDVSGIRVGSAHDEAVRSGVTVILPDSPVRAVADVRGGGPGTRETDALRLDTLVDVIDALVLSGGSVYGLSAADTVCRLLGARGRGFSLIDREGVPKTPVVPAAILYDLVNGGNKDWGTAPPYAKLAEKALDSVAIPTASGRVGAGYGAEAGAYPGGLGSASWVTPSGYVVGALAAVNSFGSPYEEGTKRFLAAPYECNGEFGGRGAPCAGSFADMPTDTKLGGGQGRSNTTLCVIATDADLPAAALKRVAVMAQDGLARALRPAHGPTDGDIVFALSTATHPVERSLPAMMEIGNTAADTLARAIAKGVFEAEQG